MKVRKLSELPNHEDTGIIETLDKAFDHKKNNGREYAGGYRFGICSDCTSLEMANGDTGVLFAQCKYFERKLSQRSPIRECTQFYKRGQLSLWDMKEIAWLIDDDRTIVGFNNEED